MTPAQRKPLTVVALLLTVVLIAGCAGTLEDLGNLMGKQRKYYDAAKEASAGGRYYEAAINAVEALKVKPDYADAKILLASVASRAYGEKLGAAQEMEKGSASQALDAYQSLKRFTDVVAEYGANVNTLDYESKFRELETRVRTVKAADAEKAYAEAETAFEARRYDDAIGAYRRAAGFAAGYKDATDKIAESYYRMGLALLDSKQYRAAAERFKKAASERASYKDSQARAARIHVALGNFFLRSGNPRKAVEEYQTASSLAPNLPEIGPGLERARREATRRLAVVGISNKTGRNIEGISVEDFIGDELFSVLQQRKSQFIELYTRTELDAVMKELKFNISDLADKQTAPELGKLKGASYVVVGKITQVSYKPIPLTRQRRSATYEVPIYQQYTEYDKRGRAQQRTRHAGNQTKHAEYDEYAWKTEVIFSGSISVFDVTTGKQVTHRNFSQEDARGGRWADNLNPADAKSSLSKDTQQLFANSRGVESADAMAKRVIRAMAIDLVGTILGALDHAPDAQDPPQLAGF
jgi:tetratricopeptide (TPR) repeat protein